MCALCDAHSKVAQEVNSVLVMAPSISFATRNNSVGTNMFVFVDNEYLTDYFPFNKQ